MNQIHQLQRGDFDWFLNPRLQTTTEPTTTAGRITRTLLCYVMLCYCYVQNYHHHLCSLWTSLLETLRCAFSCRDINPAPGPTSAHLWMWIGWSRMMLYINNLIVLAFTQPCHGVYAALAVWLVQLTSSARKISWPGTSLFKKVLFIP